MQNLTWARYRYSRQKHMNVCTHKSSNLIQCEDCGSPVKPKRGTSSHTQKKVNNNNDSSSPSKLAKMQIGLQQNSFNGIIPKPIQVISSPETCIKQFLAPDTNLISQYTSEVPFTFTESSFDGSSSFQSPIKDEINEPIKEQFVERQVRKINIWANGTKSFYESAYRIR